MIGIGLIGYGYFGPNLARNFAAQPDCELLAICELNEERSRRAAQTYRNASITRDYQDLLSNPNIHAVLIATPVHTHFGLARAALQAGKDVFVEKPITRTVAEAEELVQIAERTGRVLAVDHTYLFTGA